MKFFIIYLFFVIFVFSKLPPPPSSPTLEEAYQEKLKVNSCPTPPPSSVCGPCITTFSSVILIKKSDVPSITSFSFQLATNTFSRTVCITRLLFSTDCYSTLFNWGSSVNTLSLQHNSLNSSFYSLVTSLRSPFSSLNYTFQDCRLSSSGGCQFQPNDTLLLTMQLYNQPYLDQDIVATSTLYFSSLC